MTLLEQISASTQLPLPFLRQLAKDASRSYRRYTIPKANGRYRVIYHPSKELKAIQRWLTNHIIAQFPVHTAATAYQKCKSIVDNALPHKNHSYLLRLDLKDFFPSISRSDLIKYLPTQEVPQSWEPADLDFFLAIVCLHGSLTIGAPSSPSLSNAVCFNLDQALTKLATDHQCAYTRYADDLFFSSSTERVLPNLEPEVRQIVCHQKYPGKLSINESKTRHYSKRNKRLITGLVITCESTLSLGRHTKRGLRSQIYRYDQLSPDEKKYLAGYLSHASAIEPSFINKLYVKYGFDLVNRAMGKVAPLEKRVPASGSEIAITHKQK